MSLVSHSNRTSGWGFSCRGPIRSDGGGSAAEEMQGEHHDPDDQQDVNDASGNVKREEPEQPENDKKCSD